jgi:UV DNA damage repair endonuclease
MEVMVIHLHIHYLLDKPQNPSVRAIYPILAEVWTGDLLHTKQELSHSSVTRYQTQEHLQYSAPGLITGSVGRNSDALSVPNKENRMWVPTFH